MKKIGLALVISLFLVGPALANSVSSGEVFDITGFNNATSTVFWTGSFTLGTMVGPSLWDVSAFAVGPLGCTTCSPTNPPWKLSSLQFDSSSDTLLGGASADFTGIVASNHLLTLTFLQGNNSTDTWTDFNATNGHTASGTFSYTVATTTPEPSSFFLLAFGLMSLAAWGLMRPRH